MRDMKSKIKHIEECVKFFKIEVPHETVKQAVEEVYKSIKKVAKIPGFRPGSAPQDLLEKHFCKDAKEEVLKRLVPEGYQKALETHKIIPVGLPKICNIDFDEAKPLTFEAEVDSRPNTRLKNYKGIRITKKRIAVTQDEVSDALERLRSAYAAHENVDRPVKKGDYAICDVEAFADGAAISKKNQNMWIQADKEASLLGLGEELVGLTKGQSKEIDTKLPENYPDKKYAGKSAKFKIVVNSVKEKILPPVDEAFAGKLNSESPEALKKEIESQLFLRKENALKVDLENQILDKFLKEAKFSVPPGLVKRQKEVLAKRLEMELVQKGMEKNEAQKKANEFDSKLDGDAKNRVKIYFILDDIAVKEKIDVNDKDIDDRFKSIAASAGKPAEEVRKYYEKENLLGGLAEEIKEMKVLEFLLKHAEISEVK